MKKRVLVVDDSATDRQLATSLLQKQGYSVIAAVDGEDALEKIAVEPPPLVVLVSSKGQDSDRYWGLKQGADDYIAKPYPDDVLLSAVAKHLQQ